MNMRGKKEGIGDSFQQETKYQRGHLPGGYLDWASKPETYKRYPSASKVQLEPPKEEGGAPLWEVLGLRRSVRHFKDEPLTKAELSQLLWAAQGITHPEYGFRTAPSAGALYPIETYLVINSADQINPGVYHYAVDRYELEQLRAGDFRRQVAQSAFDQEMVYHANVVFIWTAVFARSKWKLAAVAQNLGSCQVGALYDDEVNALLGVDGTEESAIYMTVVGREK